MHTRSSLTQHQREQLIQLYEQGTGSKAAARELNISRYAAEALERRYKLHGRLCLMEKPTKQRYPYDIKKRSRHPKPQGRIQNAPSPRIRPLIG